MSYWFSTLSLILIALGLWRRAHRRQHIILMSSAFAIDLGLVLVIEISLHAVERIVAHQVEAFTVFHAAISLGLLILYIVMALLGVGIIKNKPNARATHRKVGVAFITFRLANYVTSFFV
jgi:hypothetical protein